MCYRKRKPQREERMEEIDRKWKMNGRKREGEARARQERGNERRM